MTHESDQAIAPSSLVIFSVDQKRYAVPLSTVERILSAAHVKPLRGASRKVVGVVHLPGQSVPVLSLRRHLGLGERKIEPTDRLLVIRCRSRMIALIAEEIEDDLNLTRRTESAPIARMHDKGLVSLDGLYLIADVDRLMNHRDECQLDKALARRRRTYGGSRPRLKPSPVAHHESGVHLQLC